MKQFVVLLTLLGCLFSNTAGQETVALSVSGGTVTAATGLQSTLAGLISTVPAAQYATLNALITALASSTTNAEIQAIVNAYAADTITKTKNQIGLGGSYQTSNIRVDTQVYLGGSLYSQSTLNLGTCTVTGLTNIDLNGSPTMEVVYNNVFVWNIILPVKLSGLSFSCSYSLDVGGVVTAGDVTAGLNGDVTMNHYAKLTLIPGMTHVESYDATIPEIVAVAVAPGASSIYVSIARNLANIALQSDSQSYVKLVADTITAIMGL